MKFILAFLALLLSGCWAEAQQTQPIPAIDLVSSGAGHKIDILVDGKLFTSYRFADDRKKPILWPVISAGGNEVARSYPLKNRPGERVDHPHHVGIWLNYGDVNGLDFWNNSQAVKPERIAHYGTIRHQKVTRIKGGAGAGQLGTASTWQDHSGNTLLEESTNFHFKAAEKIRIIDRITTLSAVVDSVLFKDNKEGMFAIRVCRELELPSDKPQKLSGPDGDVVQVDQADNTKVSGNYLSSEGMEGSGVWGTRAKWMKLHGLINGEKVAIIIFDHPENVGYPTYWHARAYGLFSANTLGQEVFSKGKSALNFSLKKGESVTFKYRLAIFSGDPSIEEIEHLALAFEQDQ